MAVVEQYATELRAEVEQKKQLLEQIDSQDPLKAMFEEEWLSRKAEATTLESGMIADQSLFQFIQELHSMLVEGERDGLTEEQLLEQLQPLSASILSLSSLLEFGLKKRWAATFIQNFMLGRAD